MRETVTKDTTSKGRLLRYRIHKNERERVEKSLEKSKSAEGQGLKVRKTGLN